VCCACAGCRFLKTSTFHPRVFKGIKVVYASVTATLLLMVRSAAAAL
jgi:hypothetical protein